METQLQHCRHLVDVARQTKAEAEETFKENPSDDNGMVVHEAAKALRTALRCYFLLAQQESRKRSGEGRPAENQIALEVGRIFEREQRRRVMHWILIEERKKR